MAEMQNNGGRRFNNVDVSTSLITIWDSSTGAQLRMSALSNGFSVAIWIPNVNPDGSRKYPVENRFSAVLNHRNAIALEEIINSVVIPAYEKGEATHAGIFTNASGSTFLEVEVNNGNFFVNLHRNCDPSTHVPRNTCTFKFDMCYGVDNFNKNTGESHYVPIQADFFVFVKTLEAYNDLAGGYLPAHGANIAFYEKNRRLMDYVKSIADAVHAQIPMNDYESSGGNYNNRSYGYSPTYQNRNSENPINDDSLPFPVTTDVNSLTDIM